MYEMISFVVCILLIALCIHFSKVTTRKAEAYVLLHSRRYDRLCELKEAYDFYRLREIYKFRESVNSKTQFDIYNYSKKIVEKIEAYEASMRDVVEHTLYNRKAFDFYREELRELPERLTLDDYSGSWLMYRKISELEKKMCTRMVLREPVLNPIFKYKVTYTSPKGRNHYEMIQSYTVDDIISCLSQIEQRNRNESKIQLERAKMTKKMRYKVLNRDGHRCQICGRTPIEHGVALHVDHIKPVAKGGKTLLRNLRALCEDCNQGKSASYNPNGLN